jgi:hypothetical protein
VTDSTSRIGSAEGLRRFESKVGPLARATGAAWLTLIALILVMANEVAMPLDFLVRPILVAFVPAVVIGLIAMLFGRRAPLAAVAIAALVVIPALWPWALALVALDVAISWFLRRRPETTFAGGRFALTAVVVLMAVSLIRLSPLVLDYFDVPAAAAGTDGPPIYILLLDGYPRIDSLEELGIDNTQFVSDLEDRGFDHYPHATSAHHWTHRTLEAMTAGTAAGIPDEPGSTDEERAIRGALRLPSDFVAIDPPASHVNMRGGRHLSAGGMNDFEIRLLGTSILGTIARDQSAGFASESLQRHFEQSLQLAEETSAPKVFVHLMAPHPPFLYAGGLTECWPGCDVFDVNADKLEMSVDEWGDRMKSNLIGVNGRVLGFVDRLLSKHPDAVIVLLSDHGGRWVADGSEVHRSFLAALTPGHPQLFRDEPHPDAVLRLIEATYP